MIRFEWDSGKEKLNARKHGISFNEAESVFYDDYAIQFYDEDHSDEEDRFLMLGLSNLAKVLIVVHCVREDGEVIRIISARKATQSEREFYTGPDL